MFRRLLNVAFIVCLVLCVALMGLWVRSYHLYQVGFWRFYGDRAVRIIACGGLLEFHDFSVSAIGWSSDWRWKNQSFPTTDWRENRGELIDQRRANAAGFVATYNGEGYLLLAPIWFPVVLTTLLAIVPWIKWSRKFSLRTMLIATTLLAVVLGMIAWLDGAWIGK